MDSYTSCIPHADLTKFMNVFQEICRIKSINTTEPNQMILVSFFTEDNALSDEIKICCIFEYQSNENQAFHFFGTPSI